MKKYDVLIPEITSKKAESYLDFLQKSRMKAGVYLQELLTDKDIMSLSINQFIELIIRTKKPQIFAESTVSGDGSDWNMRELSILGDISFTVPVRVYDNGLHFQPEIHKSSFDAVLLYTPGILLRNDRHHPPADWKEVIRDDKIDYNLYYSLYERRILPLFAYSNMIAGSNKKKAFITIPGLGCGQFAGKYRGQLEVVFGKVLKQFLTDHGGKFTNIEAVYYDPYNEGDNEREEINGISFLIRPLMKGNEQKPQLCLPEEYEEEGDDFKNCDLFSFVAWDHVSWPGNDFYIGSRATDDGVKAAATNSMFIMTGVEGKYNPTTNKYETPERYKNWRDVIEKNNISLSIGTSIEKNAYDFMKYHHRLQKRAL